MKANKFRLFECTFNNGMILQLKSPVTKLTEQTAKIYAPHWANMDKTECIKIVGIK